MDQIRVYFEKIAKLSDVDWDLFSSKLEKQEFPKRTMILKAGTTENYLSFIEKGIVRLCIPRDFDELTFGFSHEGTFVSAYDSFLTQSPSKYHIETITDTVLWRVTYTDLQLIYKHTTIGNTIGRGAAEALFLEKSKRELSLLNDTAEQRYRNLFTEKPHLFQQIPLKFIASYIGITPQALSRIRKRIS